jgi:hypothetical protein
MGNLDQMNIVTTQEFSSITGIIPPKTADEVLALITRLHQATRDFDHLYRGDTERYGPAYEMTSDISAVADELATLLGVSIDEAWAPVLAKEAVV